MKVSDIKDVNAQFIQHYQRNESAAAATDQQTAAMKPEEKVHLSTTAREIQKAKVAVSELPDIREEKVQAIKAQVEKGTYNVSGEQIAEKMVGESIVDLFA
ncbi:MAG: flagellar biosynthesis anti-sigma factor FlgM [Deltaproteobacteria bacterium]|jgi:negative regulator of flagellin synthesis FlgM|nr:flagellar biosynthesis anti-sigma factor FlgM [Syntrophaceae bacterium]